MLQAKPGKATDPSAAFHHHEVFAPVATLLPYDGELATAATIVGLGNGSLVTTVYSDDRKWVAGAVANMGPYLGRLVIADEKIAAASMSPGCVFPVANHGGPGRAGGGAELGGVHGHVAVHAARRRPGRRQPARPLAGQVVLAARSLASSTGRASLRPDATALEPDLDLTLDLDLDLDQRRSR